MNSFQKKKMKKIGHYRNQKEKNLKIFELNPGLKVFSEELSGIPMGQPIHGEKDRKYREKLAKRAKKGYDALDKAEYYDKRIETVEKNKSIFSDDPDAICKIIQKIEDLEEINKLEKVKNKKLKKFKTKSEAIAKFKDSSDPIDQQLSVHLEKTFHYSKDDDLNFFHFFDTTSNRQEIRRLKKRLAFLQDKKSREPIDFCFGNIQLKEVDGQIRVIFPEKPNAKTRGILKKYPFSLKYSRYSSAWVRKMTMTTNENWLNNLKRYLDSIKDCLEESKE